MNTMGRVNDFMITEAKINSELKSTKKQLKRKEALKDLLDLINSGDYPEKVFRYPNYNKLFKYAPLEDQETFRYLKQILNKQSIMAGWTYPRLEPPKYDIVYDNIIEKRDLLEISSLSDDEKRDLRVKLNEYLQEVIQLEDFDEKTVSKKLMIIEKNMKPVIKQIVDAVLI